MIEIFIFCEGEPEDIFQFESLSDIKIWLNGFYYGANKYGAGSVNAYCFNDGIIYDLEDNLITDDYIIKNCKWLKEHQ